MSRLGCHDDSSPLDQVVSEGRAAQESGTSTSKKFTADLMDQFFKDPNMQQLLYKYLPEPMRNPETFEWMLSNPEYRKQLEAMMEQQVSQLLGKHLAAALMLWLASVRLGG
jgi:hypothetical protein